MKHVVLFCISLIGSLIGLEAYVARFHPQLVSSRLPDTETGCYVSDPILFAKPKPNTTCIMTTPEYRMRTPINAQGFIGTKPTAVEKKATTRRIAFIGDSMTFGQGVPFETAYPFRVGAMLGADVINASMIGSGPDWYYLRLKESVLAYRPDIVVVGIFLGNDFADLSYFRSKQTDSQGLPAAIETPYEYVDADGVRRSSSTPLRYRIPIIRNSHLIQLLANRIFGSYAYVNQSPQNGAPCLLQPSCNTLDQPIERTVRLVRGMKSLTEGIRAPLVIVLIPWELQLPAPLLARSRINFYAADGNRRFFGERLAQRFSAHGITVIDLLPAFEAYRGEEPLLYPMDRHWTAAGHRVAAEAIAPVIADLLK